MHEKQPFAVKKQRTGFSVFTVLVLLFLGIFQPHLLQWPHLTPGAYLEQVPHLTLGSGLILTQPSSTFLVYFLGVEVVLLGISFLNMKAESRFRWWGISMLFWGVGALLAGTSYQAFGYELKCAGNPFCLFTDWFELAYYYFTAAALSSLGIAVAQTILEKKERKFLYYYAVLSFFIYVVLLMAGAAFDSRILLSYELFTVFFMPLFVVFFIYSVIKYRRQRDRRNKRLITTWLLFLVVNVSYYVYYFSGNAGVLYRHYHIWFPANDLLHLLLIFWMAFIWLRLKKVL